ncbi:P-loop NTPase fold protein [Hymenobacter sp. AT01-02]|uniref:KAP family P-loop NTPase fold protein n=1 Tax=Hymenobacter sp. AT01-02 TaxID=1571877 RepID=UPI0006E3245B|nr:P-loop NTPase fold protein [Hymenobacter sp. AT01-02]
MHFSSLWLKVRAFGGACRKAALRLIDPETYSKRNIFLFGVLLVAFVLWKQLLGLYNQYVVAPALSQVPRGHITDVAASLLAIASILFFYTKVRAGYRLSFWQRMVLFVPGLLYAAALFFNGFDPENTWNFYTFHSTERLRYADTVLLLLLGGVVLTGYSIWIGASAPRPSGSYLQEDVPLTRTAADSLNWRPEARRVAQQITSLSTHASFAIGVLGKWGDGKSSFLKLIESELTDTKAIVIHFNPWLVESTAAIRKDFFATLKERLGDYSGELASEIGTYANGLASVYDNTAAKAVKEAASFFWDTPTLTEQFKKVNEVIARLRRKIIIFIDDIDRLDKDEVLETLRLVRNTASFGNTIFVLAYDKQYVSNAVKLTNQANSSQYLDKIVQLEIPLPQFNPTKLAQRTLDIIQQSTELRPYHPALKDLLIGNTASRPADTFQQHYAAHMHDPKVCFYPEVITNMRAAIRFTNLFTFDFLPLAKEVQLDEMVNLTLLKFKHPALYEAIKSMRVVKPDFDIMAGRSESIIKVHEEGLDAFYKQNPVETDDKELLDKLIQHLFGNDHLPPGQRTIQRPSSFSVYFSAGSFDNVPLAELEELRLGSATAIMPKLIHWQGKEQLAEAFEVLVHVREFNDRADFENVATAVLAAGSILDRSVIEWMREINSLSKQIIENLYRQDVETFKQFFRHQFANAKDPYLYEAHLAYNIKADAWRGITTSFFLSDSELNQFTLNYLSRYLDANKKVDYTAFGLHRWNGEKVDRNNMICILPAANELMKHALQAYPDTALQALIVPTGRPPQEKHLTFQPFLMQIFGSWPAVDGFIASLPDSEQARQVQAEYQLYKDSGYREFIRTTVAPA